MSISYLGESFDPLITHAEQKLRLGTVARDTFGRQWSYVKFYADVAAGQYVRDMIASDLIVPWGYEAAGEGADWNNPTRDPILLSDDVDAGALSLPIRKRVALLTDNDSDALDVDSVALAGSEASERYIGAVLTVANGAGAGQVMWCREVNGQDVGIEPIYSSTASLSTRGLAVALSGYTSTSGLGSQLAAWAPGRVLPGPTTLEPETAARIELESNELGRDFVMPRGFAQTAVTVEGEGKEPCGWVLQKGFGVALADYDQVATNYPILSYGQGLFAADAGQIGGLFNEPLAGGTVDPYVAGLEVAAFQGNAGADDNDWDEYVQQRVRAYIQYAAQNMPIAYSGTFTVRGMTLEENNLIAINASVTNDATSMAPVRMIHGRRDEDIL